MRHAWSYLTAAALACPLAALEAQTPTLLDKVRAAMQLPAIVDSVRKNAGASEAEVRGVLAEQERRRIPAHEARDVLQAADAAAREHGPVDNFGAFVQAQLASGKRGRALAEAIRQEHALRGKEGGGRTANKSMAAGQGKAADARGKAAVDASSKGGAAKQAGGSTGAKAKGKGRP